MTGLARDIRFGIRMLAKTPGHTLAAVVALGLGIGLSTAMFSIIYGVLLRGLPFEDSEEILHLENNNPSREQNSLEVFHHDFLDWRERQKSFEGLAAYYEGTVNLSGDERAERYEGAFISANTFDLLRVRPLLGRAFRPGEDSPAAEPAVILGYGVWRTRYNGDPGVLGRKLRVNGMPGTIVGVMPQGFQFPESEVWVPLRQDVAKAKRGEGETLETLEVIGRLRDGVTAEQAQAEMSGIARALAAEYPLTNQGRGAVVKPYIREELGPEVSGLLYTMLGACLFVLLIACANVASLMMARASKRTREIAIRSSLGANRRNLIRQLLLESLLLAAVGTGLGLLLAQLGVRAFNAAIVDSDPPFWIHIAIDPVSLLFALAVTVVAGLLSGFLPALQASRANLAEVLNDEGRGSSSLRMGRFTRAIVVAEVALSCVLLIGSGLMIKNVVEARERAAIVPTERLFTARIALFEASYPEEAARVRFFDTLLARLRDLPGVESVAATTSLPIGGSNGGQYQVEGRAYPTERDYPLARHARITPGFFAAFGQEVLQGRDFGALDRAGSLPVAIVNRSFAAQTWPGEDALGKRFRFKPDPGSTKPNPWRTVVGVVPDLGMGEPDDEDHQGFYIPLAQDNPGFVSLVVKTREGNPLAIADEVREQVMLLDKDLPIYFVESMAEIAEQSTFFFNLFAWLFSIFGVSALVLASVGIYGVIAFSVNQRTQEIGIRMALGAQRGSVLRLILRQGMLQLLLGLVFGIALAVPVAKLLGGVLVGVEPSDPSTFTLVALVLTGVALFACWIPAQRATRTDPLVAIRYD